MYLTESPIFIVGPGRSGTTLMRKILSAHSRISILPETHFMKWVDRRGNIHGSPANFEAFWREYTSWIRFTYLGVDADYCLKLIDQQGDQTFQSIFRAVLASYNKRSGKARVGEKSPSHAHYLSLLLEWFPKANVIIMQRDPRAVVASKLGTPWVRDRITPPSLKDGLFINSRLHELVSGADTWTNTFEEIVPAWETDPRVLVVSYEELCRDPEREVRSICRFLGETFEEEMLTARKRENVFTPAGKTLDTRAKQWTKHHKKTEDPISTDSLNKWKKNLTQTETAMVEARCIEAMKKRGYTPSISPFKRFVSQALPGAFIVGRTIEAKSRKFFRWVRQKLP